MVLLSAAWTCGSATPARADAAATPPAVLRAARRDRPLLVELLTVSPLGLVLGREVNGEGYRYTLPGRASTVRPALIQAVGASVWLAFRRARQRCPRTRAGTSPRRRCRRGQRRTPGVIAVGVDRAVAVAEGPGVAQGV